MARTLTLKGPGLVQRLLGRASWQDYYQMTKPNVVMLLLLTALVGMCVATQGWLPWQPVVFGLLGIGLVSGAAAVLNHVVDRKIDEQMARTHHRPLPRGVIEAHRALAFAAMLAVIGSAMLWLLVNPLTAVLTLFGLVGYAGVYTMYLKRATPQNIVIGGLAGAIPPLLGWTAVTGQIDGYPLLLVMIIFTWTPPHFWALAIHRRNDYARVNVPMLPVTHGIEFTKTAVLLYTLLLFVVGLIPFLAGMNGWLYAIGASGLNLAFIYYAVRLKFGDEQVWAMKTFRFSIVHLMLLFIVILVDHFIA
ncbi:protoheme IX farnesyltransferase [Neiella sp. HB171785]|uniref:Protoheme IX farnesyltransferase n=1 Tax=Neiella litorisoli TaxID=2771431 RepID=A0A8J6UJT9_9GAMM|nr:heme o synthase [Neiella litorisoli]MBD1391128.1 protoheme IX farnesyltransferase [Neiella litorisoli]